MVVMVSFPKIKARHLSNVKPFSTRYATDQRETVARSHAK